MSFSYSVVIEPFAESHFIRDFEKKYHGAWTETREAIIAQCQRIEAVLGRVNYIETICDTGNIIICKHEFRIAGPGPSRHASGNRCIVAVDKKLRIVHILLVYGKYHVKSSHETAWWKGVIKENYADCFEILKSW